MTISETTTRNYESTHYNTLTATQMALTAHNLSEDGTYARQPDGSLWIWSDRRNAWVQIDFQNVGDFLSR